MGLMGVDSERATKASVLPIVSLIQAFLEGDCLSNRGVDDNVILSGLIGSTKPFLGFKGLLFS